MAKRTDAVAKFVDHFPDRGEVIELFEREDFDIGRIERLSFEPFRDQAYYFFVKPPAFLRDAFGLEREILVFGSEPRELPAKDVQQANSIIARHVPYLESDFFFLFSYDPAVEKKIPRFQLHDQPSMIALAPTLLKGAPQHPIRSLLQRHLQLIDLFSSYSAISDPGRFFGRKTELVSMRESATKGQSVGLFGLRKVGKTSLLFQLRNELRQQPGTIAIYADVAKIDAANPTPRFFLLNLLRGVYAAIESMSNVVPTALLSSDRQRILLLLSADLKKLDEDKSGEQAFEIFERAVKSVFRTEATSGLDRVVFLLDEFEHMFPHSVESNWAPHFVRLLRFLRGLSQDLDGKLCFVLAGRNPHCIEASKVLGVENPIFSFVAAHYLQPLDYASMAEMMRVLGRRMGLDLSDHDAMQACYDQTGGHPRLAREFGSALHRVKLNRTDRVVIQANTVLSVSEDVRRRAAPVCAEMVDVLRDHYTEEYELLELLAGKDPALFKEYCEAYPAAVSHLEGYGLVVRRDGQGFIRIKLLQEWMLRRRQAEPSDGRRLDVGTVIGDRFELKGRCGKDGGLSQVFLARDLVTGESVAIKILHIGIPLTRLEREYDILSNVYHPNVVRVIAFGKLVEGRPFLAMEYADGKLLSEAVTAGERFAPELVADILHQALSALDSLHRGEMLINQTGYVHRDIKPPNLVWNEVRRELKILDFNISTRVGSPAQTISHTPGYFPPDYVTKLPEAWGGAVDLFALGVTGYQLLTGSHPYADDPFVPKPVRDVRREIPKTLAEVIDKAVRARERDRYRDAAEMLQALSRTGLIPG